MSEIKKVSLQDVLNSNKIIDKALSENHCIKQDLSSYSEQVDVYDDNYLTYSMKKYQEEDFEDAVKVSKNSNLIKELDYDSFINSLSNSKFADLDGFNEFIKNQVKDAGYGTANGVVAAAMAFAYEYAKETGNKYFFTNDFDITMRGGTEGVVPNVTNLDCRGFVQWAVYNGGFKASEIDYRSNFQDWAEKNGLVNNDITAAKPGDNFSGSGDGGIYGGHIWLVVGTFDGGYYVAEEYGHNNGLVINKYTYEEHAAAVEKYNAKLYDMSKYYNDTSNVRKDEGKATEYV